MDTGKTYFYGVLFAFSAYLFVSFGDALIKKALEMHDLVFVAFYTNIISLITLAFLAPFTGGYRQMITTPVLKLHLIRAFLFLGVYMTFLYAIANMDIAQTYTLYLTQPFILVVLAHFITKEKIGIHRIISILISFCGVLIVLRPGIVPIELAALSAILCAFLFACGNILVKFMHKNDHWMSYVFIVLIVQTPILGLYLIYTGSFSNILIPSAESLPWIISSGIIYTFALGLFPLALHRIDAAMFGALEYSVLIWGTLFGYFLFAEIPDIWTMSGAAIIVASGLYLVYRERKAGHKISA